MWSNNTNYSWAPWHNTDLDYRPHRRIKDNKSVSHNPYDLYKNFVTVQSDAIPTTSLSKTTSRSTDYDNYFERGESWRFNPYSRPIRPPRPLMMERPRLNRPDFWTPRAVAPIITNPHLELWNDFNAPPKPLHIKFLLWKSAKECGVKWSIPINIEERKNMKHYLKIYENQILLESKTVDAKDDEFRWPTIPGELYTAELRIKNDRDIDVAYGSIEFKAIFSIEEMTMLLDKAIEFCTSKKSSTHPFTHVYRCKPTCYWQDIQNRTNRVMIKYIKDENGQAASPINGVIYGLFFSARLLSSGMLPPSSPFGDLRMTVPAEKLLDPELVNFYFSDFYCNKLTHYVTIVICRKDSDTDRYCRQKLIKLNPDNIFVGVTRGIYGYEFYVNKKVWVELYYTENVPVAWGRFDRIQATGIGTSRIGGLPHNKTCRICNLYPIDRSSLIESNNNYQYEEDEEEIIAKEQLLDKVNLLKDIGLSEKDGQDIVFLIGNLVDRVAYEHETSNDFKINSNIFDGTKVSSDEAFKMLDDPDLANGPFKSIVEKIKRVNKSISDGLNDLSEFISLKKRRVETENIDNLSKDVDLNSITGLPN